jgi:hypothetical protein
MSSEKQRIPKGDRGEEHRLDRIVDRARAYLSRIVVSKRTLASDASERRSSLQKDFAIFREPGFLITLVLILLLGAALTGVLLYSTTKYAIPPF